MNHVPSSIVPCEARQWDKKDYAMTHCRICVYGHTQLFKDGSRAISCLLKQVPVSPDLIHCDRYDLRDDEEKKG